MVKSSRRALNANKSQGSLTKILSTRSQIRHKIPTNNWLSWIYRAFWIRWSRNDQLITIHPKRNRHKMIHSKFKLNFELFAWPKTIGFSLSFVFCLQNECLNTIAMDWMGFPCVLARIHWQKYRFSMLFSTNTSIIVSIPHIQLYGGWLNGKTLFPNKLTKW